MSSGTFILPVLLTDPVGNYPYICILHSIEMRDTLRVVGVSNCCVPPIRGNTTGDASELVNVLDLNYLIAYMFSGGRPPACLEEGNINADGGINVLDVNFLVTYMFSGGPAPVACP